MRLINVETLQLEEFFGETPPYAILSHRWGDEEVSFQAVQNDQREHLTGWVKILGCCNVAQARGIPYVWVDTCCIDKTSSAELTESINSMFAWYRNAEECYVFFHDFDLEIHTDWDISNCQWFNRGWTLQELIAPRRVYFYSHNWTYLASKADLADTLSQITGINVEVLTGTQTFTSYSVAQRMAWAASRQTTRVEDLSYCLLGLFQVNMPLLYGEGHRAFTRLQEEIIKKTDDHTILAWHGLDSMAEFNDESSVLAPSVAAFKNMTELKVILATNDKRFGHSMSNAGLTVHLMLLPWTMHTYVAPLSCGYLLPADDPEATSLKRGYTRLAIFLRKTLIPNQYIRVSYTDPDTSETFDTVLLNSDAVAQARDVLGIKDSQIIIRRTTERPVEPLFYGIELCVSDPKSKNKSDTQPADSEGSDKSGKSEYDDSTTTLRDIRCEDLKFEQDHSLALFSVIGAKLNYRGALCIRLSHDWNPLYMHVAFDAEFAPICLISTLSLPLSQRNYTAIISGPYRSPLQCLRIMMLKDRMPLSWILAEIEKGESPTTMLAFKGMPFLSTEVVCPDISSKITFEISRSELRPTQKVWRVTIQEMQEVENPESNFYAPRLAPERPKQIGWSSSLSAYHKHADSISAASNFGHNPGWRQPQPQPVNGVGLSKNLFAVKEEHFLTPMDFLRKSRTDAHN